MVKGTILKVTDSVCFEKISDQCVNRKSVIHSGAFVQGPYFKPSKTRFFNI